MRAPLPRFVLLGALLFAASRALAPASGPPEVAAATILPAAEIEALRQTFVAERARAPGPEELAARMRSRSDEEVLFQAALAEGLDREDPVVERRLAENLRFLGAEEDHTKPGEVVAAEMRLHDPVVRRRLVNRMRLRIADATRGGEPSEEELAAEYARQAEVLREPPRVRISQHYLGPAPALALPRDLPLQSEAMLARSFGPQFASAVFSLAPGPWSGPLRSAHGLHRVRVEAHEAGALPPLSAVRAQLRDAVLSRRDSRAVQQALVELRRRHPVRFEAGASG